MSDTRAWMPKDWTFCGGVTLSRQEFESLRVVEGKYPCGQLSYHRYGRAIINGRWHQLYMGTSCGYVFGTASPITIRLATADLGSLRP